MTPEYKRYKKLPSALALNNKRLLFDIEPKSSLLPVPEINENTGTKYMNYGSFNMKNRIQDATL